MVTESEIAWAAGLFDGEGSASTYLPRLRLTPRRQMQVSQGGVEGELPAVLLRFQLALQGVGSITGPYRGYLYYWKTTRNDAIDDISSLLWPFLSAEKRGQLTKAARTVGRPVPAVGRSTRAPELERAWAAGLFDGEGCITVVRRAASPWRGVDLYLSQSSSTGVPDTMRRFHRAVGALGALSGPHEPRNPWSRLPQYRWRANGRHVASQALRILWPHLGPVTRARVLAARSGLDPDFQRGDPDQPTR